MHTRVMKASDAQLRELVMSGRNARLRAAAVRELERRRVSAKPGELETPSEADR